MTKRKLKVANKFKLTLLMMVGFLVACQHSQYGDGQLPTQAEWNAIISKKHSMRRTEILSVAISDFSCRVMEKEGITATRELAVQNGIDPERIRSYARCTLNYKVTMKSTFTGDITDQSGKIVDQKVIYLKEGESGAWMT